MPTGSKNVWNGGGCRENLCEPTKSTGKQLVGYERVFSWWHWHHKQTKQTHQRAPGNEQIPYHSSGSSLSYHPQESHLLCKRVSCEILTFLMKEQFKCGFHPLSTIENYSLVIALKTLHHIGPCSLLWIYYRISLKCLCCFKQEIKIIVIFST